MKATFIAPDGSNVQLEVEPGDTLMRAATLHGLEGIVADCGGSLTCGTCHVFVDPRFADRVPAVSPQEDQMLDFTAATRQGNSRLSCQIVMTAALDGISVRVADPQT